MLLIHSLLRPRWTMVSLTSFKIQILTCALDKRAKTSKTRKTLEENEMKVLREIFGKIIIDRIRSQKIGESCVG